METLKRPLKTGVGVGVYSVIIKWMGMYSHLEKCGHTTTVYVFIHIGYRVVTKNCANELIHIKKDELVLCGCLNHE